MSNVSYGVTASKIYSGLTLEELTTLLADIEKKDDSRYIIELSIKEETNDYESFGTYRLEIQHLCCNYTSKELAIEGIDAVFGRIENFDRTE